MDIMLDSDLNPYLLEINKGPEMSIFHPKDYNLRKVVFNDMLGIVKLKNTRNNSFKLLKKTKIT